MTDEHLKIILAELREKLSAHYGERLEKLVLFGSRARGDADPDSDIDVMVVLKGEVDEGKEINATVGIIAEISLKYDCLVMCVFASASEYRSRMHPLLMNVRREGLVL